MKDITFAATAEGSYSWTQGAQGTFAGQPKIEAGLQGCSNPAAPGSNELWTSLHLWL